VLRRASKSPEAVEQVSFGDVEMNFKTFEASKGGRALELSPREFKMMKYFVEHRGEVVTRDQLLDHVWGYEGLPLTRTVDMHIAKLRQKIEDTPSDPHHVITVHRVGYKFTG
jgi:DNA-binding response OmpR family regulator